jgi:hypothetical protein
MVWARPVRPKDDPRELLIAARLAEAMDRLVAERLLLAEDGDRLVAAARETWDVFEAL